ncbi:MAG: hypothetical protein Q9196_000747 [Gyalolechia fulgens]
MAITTRDFHHPYEPYEIQEQLMNAIYDCISAGKVGIFESPTGTGKSLSIICSTLTWLREEQRKAFDQEVETVGDNNEPAWILEQARRQRTEKLVQQRLELETRLARVRDKELRLKQQYEKGEPAKKRAKCSQENFAPEYEDERQYVLDDYESDDDTRKGVTASIPDERFSTATRQLMQRLGGPSAFAEKDANTELPNEPKVFFCSRTHSQLTQFVNELRRVQLPPAPWVDFAKDSRPAEPPQRKFVKHVALGSRKNLCINPKVADAGSTTAINERCLDLQQPSTRQDKRCGFLPSTENEALVNEFRDHTLASIQDIEDLGALVTLPYQLLLLKSAREALGISLKGHVVIIDEAHNLVDAISSIYSIAVTQAQLHRCQSQLRIYLQKFRNKLKGKNRVYVAQTVRLIDSVSERLDNMASGRHSNEALINVSDLMSGKGVDQINLYKLVRYLNDSKLARKVDSYVDSAAKRESSGSESRTFGTPVLTHVQGFLQTLMNPAAEGRFFFQRDESDTVALKYMLLDPTFHFKEIVDDARAVVLAGGTMSPMDYYARHLFAYVPAERLETWSCGHIIPKENLFVRCSGKSPEGRDLDFSFASRGSVPLIDALGSCLVHLASAVPDGLVVFFPSYAYLDQVSIQWQREAADSMSTWHRLERQKVVLKESKGSSSVEEILQRYTRAVDEGRGALLMSVVGGKLSEGINFSDKLGRGVVVVGLPFPNIHGAQWKAKLEYIERDTIDRGGSSAEGKAACRDFYENACMRAVNQSIGRAIRHQKDFASILLLDRRYSTPRISNKLPGWIKQGFPKIYMIYERPADPSSLDITSQDRGRVELHPARYIVALLCHLDGSQLPIVAHCDDLVAAILHTSYLPRHNDVQTWGRGLPSDAHTESLPKIYWLAGRGPQTCAIELDADPLHLDARETFRLRAVGVAGVRIQELCLKSRGQIGRDRLGPNGHVIAKLVRSDSSLFFRMTRGAKGLMMLPGWGELMEASGTYNGTDEQ